MDSNEAAYSQSSALAIAAALAAVLAFGSATPASAGAASKSAQRPVSRRVAPPTRSAPRVKLLVRIPVVARDSSRRAVGGLRLKDFRLFADGRGQKIYGVAETIVSPPPRASTALSTLRYIALYFDDLHLDSTEMIRATDGADAYFASNLGRWDRLGIFTASGENTLDFTNDHAKLHQTLLAIRPHPPAGDGCPAMSDYEAYLILDVHQPMAREVGIEEAARCGDPPGKTRSASSLALPALRRAQSLSEAQARRVVAAEDSRSVQVLDGLDHLIDKVATLPDPRSITVFSPGFLDAALERRVDQIAKRAVKLNIAINTMDLSTQITEPAFDTQGLSPTEAHQVELDAAKYQMRVDQASMAADVLTDLAADTAGNFVPNTYDPEFALPMAIPLPSSHYVLSFYPSDLRANGDFHSLRIELLKHPGLMLQAANGYFAPGMPPQAGSPRVRREAPRRVRTASRNARRSAFRRPSR